jgi:hypothetical protein
MWKDPRTDYGDTREQLEKHMLAIAGMPNTRELGPDFSEGMNAVVDGRITDPRQIAIMVARGTVTASGGRELYDTLGRIRKPDDRLNAEYQARAFNQVKDTVLKDMNETDPATQMGRPSGKQLRKLNDIQTAILDSVKDAKGDTAEVAKRLRPEAIDELTERIYPQHERRRDYLSRYSPVNVNGITIPGNVSHDTKSQAAYLDIVAAPPIAMDKEGKPKPIDRVNWQKAVNLLLSYQSPEAKEHFKQLFPNQDPDYIIRSINPIAPPPGYAPPPLPTATREASELPAIIKRQNEAPQFSDVLTHNLFPPRPGATTAPIETPISNFLFGRQPKAEEANK